jgi:hypothetical protein
MTTANEALFGKNRGAPAWRWGAPGDSAQGVITALSATQQRDMRTKELKYFPSGDPIMIALVTVQTGLHDPTLPADNGERTIWVSGRYMTKAVKDAMMRAGTRELEVGGWFEVTYTHDGPAERGLRPPRMFTAEYIPPTPEERSAAEAAAEAASDPWAAVGQGLGTGTPPGPVSPAQSSSGAARGPAGVFDPWGDGPVTTPPSRPTMSASTGPVDKINSPAGSGTPERSGSPAQGSSGAAQPPPVPGAPAGGGVDLPTLTPEARAVIERMIAEQQQQEHARTMGSTGQ